MHVLILRADLHIPAAQSLKAKRSVLVPMVRHLDAQSGVGAAEIDHADTWQRTSLGVSAVGNSVSHLEQVMDGVERYLWSRPDVDVLDLHRSWWDED